MTAPTTTSCIAAEPDWAKGHYRLAAALLGAKDLCGALGAADAAEQLDPLPLYTKTKQAALELLLDAQRRGGCVAAGRGAGGRAGGRAGSMGLLLQRAPISRHRRGCSVGSSSGCSGSSSCCCSGSSSRSRSRSSSCRRCWPQSAGGGV